MHFLYQEQDNTINMQTRLASIEDGDVMKQKMVRSLTIQNNQAEGVINFYVALFESGTVMMPLNNYGFSQKFGWLVDQFGVSWQLNME